MSDEFHDRVVVSDSATSIDTDRLAASCHLIAEVRGHLATALTHLDAATQQCSLSELAPVETGVALASLAEARSQVEARAEELQAFENALVQALLVLGAADLEAAQFNALLGQFRPGAVSGWHTGWGSVHQPDLADVRISLGDAEAPRWMYAGPLMAPERLLQIEALIINHMNEFKSNPTDGTLGARLEYDIAAVADELVHRSVILGDATTYGELSEDEQVRTASSLLATWFAGLGLLGYRSAGVRVSTGTGADGKAQQTRWVESGPEGGRAVLPPIPALQPTAILSGLPGFLSTLPAGEAERVPGPAGRPPAATETPHSASQALARIGELAAGRDEGRIEILEHEHPDGTRSWSVIMSGTQEWLPGSDNPQDLLSNLQAVAGQQSDQRLAVLTAMEMAGIQSGEAVELVGHSQAGIIAAQLASDPGVLDRYDIVSTLTAGSPTAGFVPDSSVNMLNLENAADIVTALDGSPNLRTPGRTTISFDASTLALVDEGARALHPHALGVYEEAVIRLENAEEGAGAQTIGSWTAKRNEALGLQEDTRTTSYLFDTVRVEAK